MSFRRTVRVRFSTRGFQFARPLLPASGAAATTRTARHLKRLRLPSCNRGLGLPLTTTPTEVLVSCNRGLGIANSKVAKSQLFTPRQDRQGTYRAHRDGLAGHLPALGPPSKVGNTSLKVGNVLRKPSFACHAPAHLASPVTLPCARATPSSGRRAARRKRACDGYTRRACRRRAQCN